MTYFAWGLQILIVTAGIHLFLRFVRTTRGNPLIRGLFLSVLVGVVGLWGVTTLFELEELQQILEGSTGLIVVGLVIIFHPELRRGIAQIGERPFAKRSKGQSKDALRRVVEAARAMAERRHGALIAFERETSLRTVIETGNQIGARINARLLESVFWPDSALHDGAVVIQENKVVAAGCYLPLSKGSNLDDSKGTRHRAALGLTEETDAVVVVVSEETGSISIARDGRLTSDVDPDRLEAELRKYIEANKPGTHRAKPGAFTLLRDILRNDAGWLAGSVLLATGAIYAAHQSIREVREYNVRVVDFAGVERRAPEEGEILILPPGDNVRVRTSDDEANFRISVTGSRAQFGELGVSLSGTLEIDEAGWKGGALDLDAVRWERSIVGLDYRWKAGEGPELVVERFSSKRIQLQPSDVMVVVNEIDRRFQARPDDIVFEPGPSLEISGPESVIAQLGDRIPLRLQDVVLNKNDIGEVRVKVSLHPELVAQNLLISNAAPVAVVPVQPVERDAGTIRKDIALVCLSPTKAELLERWALPANAQTARFTIVTSGIIPVNADIGSPALVERKTAITRFVEENLRVYVDVAELPPPSEGRSVAVRTAWVNTWRESPSALGLDDDTLIDWAELDVRLDSEPLILLEETRRSQGAESP